MRNFLNFHLVLINNETWNMVCGSDHFYLSAIHVKRANNETSTLRVTKFESPKSCAVCSHMPQSIHMSLTLGAHAQRGLQYLVCHSVCLSVCLSVTTFSPATRNKTAKKRYQLVQCHTGFILKMTFLVKMLRSKVMAWKQSERANMQISNGLPRPALRTLEAPEVATQGEYRLPRVIYQCNKPVTDSQRAGKRPRAVKNGPAHQLIVPRMRTV